MLLSSSFSGVEAVRRFTGKGRREGEPTAHLVYRTAVKDGRSQYQATHVFGERLLGTGQVAALPFIRDSFKFIMACATEFPRSATNVCRLTGRQSEISSWICSISPSRSLSRSARLPIFPVVSIASMIFPWPLPICEVFFQRVHCRQCALPLHFSHSPPQFFRTIGFSLWVP